MYIINKNTFLKIKEKDDGYHYWITHRFFEKKGVIEAEDIESAAAMLLFDYGISIENCITVSKEKFQMKLNLSIDRAIDELVCQGAI